MSPVAEMTDYLADWRAQARAGRKYDELLSVEAAQEIHRDVTAGQSNARRTVYGEEQRNRLNAQELHAILADGKVTADEVPALHRLASRELKSADILRVVTEALS